MNSIRNKIDELEEISKNALIEVFAQMKLNMTTHFLVINFTWRDTSFHQFHITETLKVVGKYFLLKKNVT